MKVLLRADSDPERGTGHVMRCLTLAESLMARGHHVIFLGAVRAVPWLERRLIEMKIGLIDCPPDSLAYGPLRSFDPDWVVVDSYRIDADDVSRINTEFPCLAIVDGDDRGIDASLYLDQNLGSELLPWREGVRARILSGSAYALIRDGILEERRDSPELMGHCPPRVVAFMGGSDPHGAITAVVLALVAAGLEIELTAICGPATFTAMSALAGPHPWVTVVEPTDELPLLLGGADAVVSASGTSAWEICTLAIPSLLVGVVENQRQSLHSAREMGVALGIDATAGTDRYMGDIAGAVRRLISEPRLRLDLATRCRALFDGAGKVRVVEAMEKWPR